MQITDVYTFAELSPRAQDWVRRRYTELDYEWWDTTLEDVVHVAVLLGLNMLVTKTGHDISWDQYFDVTYKAAYGPPKESPSTAVREYAPQDEDLHAIADKLTTAQVTAKLQHGECVTGNVTDHYSRDMYANLWVDGVDLWDKDYNLWHDFFITFKDFASWIGKQLEAEYDYLTSDEHIEDMELKFDENGDEL